MQNNVTASDHSKMYEIPPRLITVKTVLATTLLINVKRTAVNNSVKHKA